MAVFKMRFLENRAELVVLAMSSIIVTPIRWTLRERARESINTSTVSYWKRGRTYSVRQVDSSDKQIRSKYRTPTQKNELRPSTHSMDWS